MEYNLKRKKSIKSLSMLNSEQTHNFNQHLKCTKARLCIRYRASLTIEAAFVLPLFVFCLALFLGLFRVLGAEVHVEKAVSCATERLAVSGVFEESSANHMLDGAVGNRWIRQILKQEGCPEEYFKNGYQGIFLDLLQSDEKFVRYRARYQINLPMGAFFKQTVSVVQIVSSRKWNGWVEDAKSGEEWVYITETGKVYHKTASCRYLDLSIQAVSVKQISKLRNKDGSKYSRCSCTEYAGGEMVYITDYGTEYHGGLNCRKLKRTVYRVQKSETGNKGACSKCYGNK